MQYVGGKARSAAWLAGHILPALRGRRLVEPFCGGLWATVALQPSLAGDGAGSVISLYKALQGGWTPPEAVSRATYDEVRGRNDEADPMTAFVGFGCSWGGKLWGGYANDGNGRNYALNASRSLAKKFSRLTNVEFVHADYRSFPYQDGDVIYCDPPYVGTTQAYGVSGWDASAFWKWAASMSGRHTIFVSEYGAPIWTHEVARLDARADMRKSDGSGRVEKLFLVGKP